MLFLGRGQAHSHLPSSCLLVLRLPSYGPRVSAPPDQLLSHPGGSSHPQDLGTLSSTTSERYTGPREYHHRMLRPRWGLPCRQC